MQSSDQYSNREIDRMFGEIQTQLTRIETQTIKHNGRLSRVERNLLIVACVSGTILFLNGPELVSFLLTIIA